MRSYIEKARRTGDIPLFGDLSVGLPVIDNDTKKSLKRDYRSDREHVEQLIEDTNPYKGRDVENFIEYLRSKGLNVKPASREDLSRTYNRDVVGWRSFNDIEYVPDKNPNVTLERLGHEYAAGFDHFRSDSTAQKKAAELFTKEWPHAGAREKTIEIGKELGWLPKWYEMN